MATAFRRVVIDWAEGDRWVEARIIGAMAVGYSDSLMQAERDLLGNSVLVSVTDEAGPAASWGRFYMTPQTDGLELNYQSAADVDKRRGIARRLAKVLGYEFETIA